MLHLAPRVCTLVEMLNNVGKRERPNLDLPAMLELHNVLSAHSFPFVKQDRSTCHRSMRTVAILPERCTGEQNGTYLMLSARQSWSTRQLACSSMCTSNPSVFAAWNHEDWEEVYTASVSHRRLQRMPSNGGEFSRWLDGSAHIARQHVYKHLEMISDKNKRVTKPRIRSYMTYPVV